MSVSALVEVVGGTLFHGSDDSVVNGLAIDSREITPGAVFVAFVGRTVDGHDFVGDALDSGARALIVSPERTDIVDSVVEARRHDVAVVGVEDPLRAVQALGAYHRSRMSCPVVAITGSTGKTTTKDLLYAVLSHSRKVVATEGNQNNELGVPLTLMRAGAETNAIVVEMAMRGLGQISELCTIAQPTHGLVTNVGETHMELLGSQDAIASAKAELVACVPDDGAVFLNGDDGWSDTLALSTSARITRYGMGQDNDVRAVDLEVGDEGLPSFALATPVGVIPVGLGMPGRHNAYNAAAAAAVALELGVGLSEIAEGLASATLTPMRMQVFTSATGVTVINDAYNASPASMRAALDALLDVTRTGRRIAVLGDMAELGSLAELAHFELGEHVGRLHLDTLVTVGEKARRIADGARATGLDPGDIAACDTVDEAASVVAERVKPGDALLVKASRVMGLERLVDAVIQPDVQP
jgi:UDP-N-acetylmuramoyl-tripeptide--D-alanyl-D-alanine ligase